MRVIINVSMNVIFVQVVHTIEQGCFPYGLSDMIFYCILDIISVTLILIDNPANKK